MVKSILLTTTLAMAAGSAQEPAPGPSPTALRESEAYRLIDLPTPPGVQFEAGALCLMGPDRLAVATRIGEIWIADKILGDPAQPEWKLFERGLHEVLGLAEKDGALFATQRGEVTRMKDTDGDGRADIVETVGDAWGIDGNYHEYAFGSRFDPGGNLWVALCLTGSFTSDNRYRGWALRISPDGKTIPMNTGIRSPGGIGFNGNGDVFYTENQGPWNGACKLQWLKPGSFAGHPAGLRWFDDPATREAVKAAGLTKPAEPESGSRMHGEAKRIPELLPPAVLFPYDKMGQSAAGIIADGSGGKFGPFSGQLFVGDQTQSLVMRVFLEKTPDGQNYQGACFPFREGLASGSLSLDQGADGSLFVFQTGRGWGSRGGKPFALQRLVWTGKTPFEIHEMRARPDGFTLTFTEPVDPASAAAPASYTMSAYTYIYQSSYGSPEVDTTKPVVERADVTADGLSIHLKVNGMIEGHLHELHLPGLRSAKGEALVHPRAYYTLNQLPK
ncbi:hypothetical protein OVA24_19025 [Luteolibacter sp. SL250]|uniref:DUF7133 domain-containing protein n=1 Tax=Luteolibacter sp. SL250 TaxID=2995170 RepID=UPI00226F04F3|nr:hypothetical protein [Luteolibacter sp. SL250]WAC19323.1 hypothetical protein OVA24_19025 [Luteolibacter sp. SL250]